MGHGELTRECSGEVWVSKAPANNAAVSIVLALAAHRFDAVPSVKFVHGVQPVAETAERHNHIHEVREIFLDGLRALSAFVAGHVQQ